MSAFNDQLSKLNPSQRQAVDTIEGPVLVIAGPGTGKTQVLTLRIAQILKETDTEPRAILAMTFTDAAAKNMQQRLATLIGQSAYKVHFSTFHAFCQQVITEFPEAFEFRAGSESLNDLERLELLEELLHQLPLQKLKTVRSEFHYFKEIQTGISELKREAISPEKLAELVAAEQLAFENNKTELSATQQREQSEKLLKMDDMAVIYQAYQTALQARQRYDYDDMIAEVAKAFANTPDLLLSYQERYTYFLVDEYQDTNAAQNLVVDQLASYWGDQANLFVVGDPHQSIYRFQGASLENTVNFIDRYPDAEVIRLNIGYRCPPAIYQAASQVIQHNPTPAAKVATDSYQNLLSELAQPLAPNKKDQVKIQVQEFPHQLGEAHGVAEQVANFISKKVQPDQIAVLYRDHMDAAELSFWLQRMHVPFQSDSGQNIWELPMIQQVLLLLQTCQKLAEGLPAEELYQVFSAPWWELDVVTVMAVARTAGQEKRSFSDQILRPYAEIKAHFPADMVKEKEFAKLQGVYNKLLVWVGKVTLQTPANWVLTVLSDAGFISWIRRQTGQTEMLRQLTTLQNLIMSLQRSRPLLTLDQLLAGLQTMQERKIRLHAPSWQAETGFVNLSSVHSAKGKEWDHVFVIGLQDKKWGNATTRKKVPLPAAILHHAELDMDDRDSDDRRLFYVAITRARQTLTLSYAAAEQSLTKLKPLQPSQFLSELPESTVEQLSAPPVSAEMEQEIFALQLQPPQLFAKDIDQKQRAFYQHLVSEFRLSATSLNHYLENPELFVEQHLLGLPQPTTATMAFGTSIHAALEYLYRTKQKDQTWPSMEAVQHKFVETLERQNIHADERVRFALHGKKQLSYYYQFATELPVAPTVTAVEKSLSVNAGVVGELPLTGKIDRIDLIDVPKKQVAVVDYKTGHDCSLNVIQGLASTDAYSPRELALPASIRGRLKRQLLFYKLLLEEDAFANTVVSHGVFEFVNEDTGKIKQRQLSLTTEDVADFKKLIQQVSQEIVHLDFL